MATTEFAVHGAEQGAVREPVVNDFSIQVATVNGSGSQSANTVLLRTIFQMGVPVSGKNMFPSNIAGLPTWYTIRASKKGYIARKKEIDFLVAMNPETAREDVMSLAPGAVALYDEPLKLNELRSDLIFYPVPYDKITAAACPESKLRKLVKNMVYVGVVARLLNLDMTEVEKALRKQFARKVKAAELNWGAAKAGYDYAAASLTKADPFTVERMNKTSGMIIIDGNSAAAIGSMFAGVTVVTWYPITPSSSLVESLIEYMKEYRIGSRHGSRRRMGRSSLHDCHCRARYFADGRVCRPGLLRRDSRSYLGHPARWPVNGAADSHVARRHFLRRQTLARRHATSHADSQRPQ
jgi:2-oxoglutarate/2-oxoacid ferredoxin oxidoreductase subunit alpha